MKQAYTWQLRTAAPWEEVADLVSYSDYFLLNLPQTKEAVKKMAVGLSAWRGTLLASLWDMVAQPEMEEGPRGGIEIVARQPIPEDHVIPGLTAVRARLSPEEQQQVERYLGEALFGPAAYCEHKAYDPNCDVDPIQPRQVSGNYLTALLDTS